MLALTLIFSSTVIDYTNKNCTVLHNALPSNLAFRGGEASSIRWTEWREYLLALLDKHPEFYRQERQKVPSCAIYSHKNMSFQLLFLLFFCPCGQHTATSCSQHMANSAQIYSQTLETLVSPFKLIHTRVFVEKMIRNKLKGLNLLALRSLPWFCFVFLYFISFLS